MPAPSAASPCWTLVARASPSVSRHGMLPGSRGRHDPLVALTKVSTIAGSYIVPRRSTQDRERLFVGHAAAIRAIGRERVEAVDDREDARADRDRFAGDAIGIAGAVPVLVVVADDGHDRIGKVDRRENLRADRRMQLHLLELGRRQLAGLVEDVFRHGDLAGVVQQRRRLDRLERRRRP